MLSRRQEYWWWGSARLAAAWIVISQVVRHPGGLGGSSIDCLWYSIMPSGPEGRLSRLRQEIINHLRLAAQGPVARWGGEREKTTGHNTEGKAAPWCTDTMQAVGGHQAGTNTNRIGINQYNTGWNCNEACGETELLQLQIKRAQYILYTQ